MKIKIVEALYKVVPELETEFKIESHRFRWNKFHDLELSNFSPSKGERLYALCEPHAKIRGVGVMLRDIQAWLRMVNGDANLRPRSVRQFESMLIARLNVVPGHRVYRREEDNDAWFACYVNEVRYHSRVEHHGGGVTPEHVTAGLMYEEFGKRQMITLEFMAEDCLAMSVDNALMKQNVAVETDELRTEYLEDKRRYEELVGQVGLQVLAIGTGTDDLDGNNRKDRWRSRRGTLRIGDNGEPDRMVIDVFQEDDEKNNDRDRGNLNSWFWTNVKIAAEEPKVSPLKSATQSRGKKAAEEEEDNRDDIEIEDVVGDRPEIEIPLHPVMACFCLRRHIRLRVHVRCVQPYVYDTTIADRLVIPSEVRDLVQMLVTTKGVFRDIIVGKGGGAVVLCAGPPGCGKTLTAEVYAEAMQRPLYSVQCSQLGTKPDELEDELMRVFARANRWNAITLLDEADVYVASRGNDLQQNAIVGVFLRVLEHRAGILFLTTNRGESVDDAIASRCIARIDYTIPSREDQRRIWRVLSDVSQIDLSDAAIDEITDRYRYLSGRDIKNLLKLAKMVADSRSETIGLATIDFVKKFKPTSDLETRS